MATYEITIPGQGTFEVSSPVPLTDQQAYQAALQQAQSAGSIAAPTTGTFISAPTPSAEVPVADSGILQRLQAQEARAAAQPRVAPTPSAALRAESLATGLLIDPIRAVAQVVGGEDTRKRIAQQEQEFQEKRTREGSTGTDWFRLVGNAVMSIVPGGAAMTGAKALGAGKVLTGAVGGAAGGALMPVTQTVEEAADPSTFALQKLRDVGFSAGAGGVVSKIGAALTPELKAGVAEQLAAGVRVAPGQAYGGVPGWVFRQMESIGFGPSERAIRNSFTRSAGNEVLSSIDQTVPSTIKDGMQMSGYIQKTIQNFYDDALEKLGRITPDTQFADDLKTVVANNVPDMSNKARKIFETKIQTEIIDRFKLGPVPKGTIAPQGMRQIPTAEGIDLKNINKVLKDAVDKYSKKPGADNEALASAFEDALNAFRSYTTRVDKDGLIAKADDAWAKLYRFADAASSTKAVQQYKGSFSAAELASAATRQATNLQAGAGTGPMGEFARRGVNVLGGEPDVLSAGYRQAVIAGKVATGGALALFSPAVAIPLLVASGITYKTAEQILKNPSATRLAVQKAIEKLGPQAVGAIVAREENNRAARVQ